MSDKLQEGRGSRGFDKVMHNSDGRQKASDIAISKR